MRAIVFSDSHGAEQTLCRLIEQVRALCGPVDYYIHLGDGWGDFDAAEPLIQAADPRAFCARMRGNCDFGVKASEECIVDFGNNRLFLTHGHRQGVKQGTGWLESTAAVKGCTGALFGHTHMPLCEWRDGMFLLNPGSARSGRIAVLEEDEEGFLQGKLYQFE